MSEELIKIDKNNKEDKRKEVAEKIKREKSYHYVGPTVKRGILSKGMVFIGDPEKLDEIKKLIEKIPLISSLMIEQGEFAKKLKELKENGRLEILSNSIKEKMKELELGR